MKRFFYLIMLMLCALFIGCGKEEVQTVSEPVNEVAPVEDEYYYPVEGAIYEASIYSMGDSEYGLTMEVDVTGNPHEIGSSMYITVVDSVCDFKLIEEITTSGGDLINAETMPQLVDAENDATGIWGNNGNYFSNSVDTEEDIADEFSVTFGVHRQSQINGDVAGYIDIRGGEMVYYTLHWEYNGDVILESNEGDWFFKLKETKYGEPVLKPAPIYLEPLEEEEEEPEEVTWFIEDNTLYVNKIYYDTVMDMTGHNMIEIEDPWSDHKGEFTSAVFDAEFVQRRKKFTMNTVIENPDYETISLESLGLNGTELESLTANLVLNDIKCVNYLLAGSNIKNIELNLQGEVNSAHSLFAQSSALETASVSMGGSPKDVADMFYCCEKLDRVKVDIDLSKTASMARMFCGCKSLESVSLSYINNGCGGIFSDCSSLNYVNCPNVVITEPGNWMFNSDNSISNYLFAEAWGVKYDVIGDSVYSAYPTMDPVTSTIMVFVTYKKFMPEWHTKFMEATQGVQDMDCIVNTLNLKVYMKAPESLEEDEVRKGMFNNIDTALKDIAANEGVDTANMTQKALEAAGYYDLTTNYIH